MMRRGLVLLGAIVTMGAQTGVAQAKPTACTFGGNFATSPPMQLMGGTSYVSGSGNASCWESGSLVAGPMWIQGTYTNSVCGTGVFDGNWTLSQRPISIQFVNFNGVIRENGAVAGHMHFTPGATVAGICGMSFSFVGDYSPPVPITSAPSIR